MKKQKSESFVTNSVFVNETTSIRADMRSMEQRLALAIIKTQSDVVKESMIIKMTLKEEIGNVLNAIDSFTHRIETYDRKTLVHDARLNDHEARITRLERPA